MESKYTIEQLIETFKDHAKKAEENKVEMRRKYAENNNGANLPYDDSFNLSEALSVICMQINNLKSSK